MILWPAEATTQRPAASLNVPTSVLLGGTAFIGNKHAASLSWGLRVASERRGRHTHSDPSSLRKRDRRFVAALFRVSSGYIRIASQRCAADFDRTMYQTNCSPLQPWCLSGYCKRAKPT